jgi:hypothetical protein
MALDGHGCTGRRLVFDVCLEAPPSVLGRRLSLPRPAVFAVLPTHSLDNFELEGMAEGLDDIALGIPGGFACDAWNSLTF